MNVDGIEITIEYKNDTDQKVTEDEVRNYIDRAKKKFPGGKLESLKLTVDGDMIGIYYGFHPVKFDRIRRITGYLVGTLDRFNDGKRAEERDRVKHGVTND